MNMTATIEFKVWKTVKLWGGCMADEIDLVLTTPLELGVPGESVIASDELNYSSRVIASKAIEIGLKFPPVEAMRELLKGLHKSPLYSIKSIVFIMNEYGEACFLDPDENLQQWGLGSSALLAFVKPRK